MPEVIFNTSPFQYLHQLEILRHTPRLIGQAIVPPAVVEELEEGRKLGVELPALDSLDWVTVRSPESAAALPLVTDLGPGETEVLLLALEASNPIVILDDLLARHLAASLKISLTGTLGLLLDLKSIGCIKAVEPSLDRLQELRFRLASHTRSAILELADEAS